MEVFCYKRHFFWSIEMILKISIKIGAFSIHKCKENQNWFHNSKVIVKLFSSFSPYFNQKQICLVPRQKDMCKWIIFNDSKNRPIWIGSIFDPSFCLLVRFKGGIFCFREYFLWVEMLYWIFLQVGSDFLGSYRSKKAPIFIEIFRIISMFQKKCLL